MMRNNQNTTNLRKLKSNKQCMQDTKLKNFHIRDTNKLRMHMRNNKTHKTREFKDQSNEIIKNNLKINEEHNACIRKMQEK